MLRTHAILDETRDNSVHCYGRYGFSIRDVYRLIGAL